MTNISKNKIPDKSLRQIKKYFKKLLNNNDAIDSGVVWEELFTDTEQIMFAKRVAIVMMLYQKCSYYEISESLYVSTDTIKKWNTKFQNGDLDTLVKRINRSGDLEYMIDMIEIIMRMGMPPRGGRDRYSKTFRMFSELKEMKEKHGR